MSMHSYCSEKIRLGWQTQWAIQGQLVQILKHTPILQKLNLNVEFVGRNYGPELNELALANQLDVILSGDLPAITLLSKNQDWYGVSRLMHNRTAVYVPIESPISEIRDLKSKTIGLPFGAAAQRILEQALLENKINPKEDVKIINLAIQEHFPLITKTSKTEKKWDQFDALSGFDPIPALIETEKKAKIIHKGKVVSLVLMHKNLLSTQKSAAQKLITAFNEAYEFYKKNKSQANTWFRQEAKSFDKFDDSVFEKSLEFENNFKNKNSDMNISDEDYVILEDVAKYVQKQSGVLVSVKDRISVKLIK